MLLNRLNEKCHIMQRIKKSPQKYECIICLSLALVVVSSCAALTETDYLHRSTYSTNPFVFKLAQPVPGVN